MPMQQTAAADQDDADAIADLALAFDAQRRAFAAEPRPTLATRRERLGALAGMLAGNRGRIANAVASDFGSHPKCATDLIEVLGPFARARFAIEHLDEWAAASPRASGPSASTTSATIPR